MSLHGRLSPPLKIMSFAFIIAMAIGCIGIIIAMVISELVDTPRIGAVAGCGFVIFSCVVFRLLELL